MPNAVKPWEGCETTEKARRALDRLAEAFAVADVPEGLVELAGSEPGIHDLYMNLKRQLEEGRLGRLEKLLVAVGVASAAGSGPAVRFLGAAAREAGVAPQQVLDAISVAAVCTLFNGYYKFRHMAGEDFESFRAPFNANAFLKSSLTTAQTELVCVAVSALNGCHACVTGHISKARQYGVTDEQIDEAIKASATAQALAQVALALAPETAAVAT